MLLLLWAMLDSSSLPRTAFFGGPRLAEKWLAMEAQERAGALDVLALGASQIDQGFDARRFGEVADLRTFNLGLAGTDTYFQSLLARELLLTGRRPKILLWGSLDSTQWRTGINYQYLNAPAVALARGPFARLAFELGQHLPQFQRRRLLEWIALAQDDHDGTGEEVDEFGRLHVPAKRAKIDEPEELEGPRRSEVDRFDYGVDLAGVRAHVEETLQLLKAENIQVWFVFTPYAQSLFERDSAHALRTLLGSTDGHLEWLKRIAPRYGLELLDLRHCSEISSDPTLFFDSTHLNGEGSLRLGALLGDLVSGRRPIPAAWRGLPAQAQFDAIFGHEPPETLSDLQPGLDYRLADEPLFFPTGSSSDVYARVEIAEAGRYRLVFEPPAALDRIGAFYVRIGSGHYRCWRAEGARRQQTLEWRLASGTHRLELHAISGQEIDWGTLTLQPMPGQ